MKVTFGEGYGAREARAEIHRAKGEVAVYAIASYKFGTLKARSAPLLERLRDEAKKLASTLAMSMSLAGAKEAMKGQRLKVYEPKAEAAAVIAEGGAPALRVSGMYLWKGKDKGDALVEALRKVLGKEFSGVKVKEF